MQIVDVKRLRKHRVRVVAIQKLQLLRINIIILCIELFKLKNKIYLKIYMNLINFCLDKKSKIKIFIQINLVFKLN